MIAPLDGIKILEWSVFQQGPAATVMLGDLGAQVIKIEEKVGGDPGRGVRRILGVAPPVMAGGRTYYLETFNRNKRSIAVDVRKERGKEIIYKLVEQSDVFVRNFRPEAATRLGLDYATLSKYNPQLIYASATGFGLKGPDSAVASYDIVGQARSGLMTQIGEPDMPPLSAPMGMCDQAAAVMVAYGILAALVARERTGIGQEVDSSLLGSAMWLQALGISFKLLLGQDLPQPSRSKAGNALWNYYKCKDDKWICFAMAQSDRYWPDFCRAVGIEELEHDPRFEDMEKRRVNGEELVAILDKIFVTKTREEWSRILQDGVDLAFGPINTLGDLMNDPQVIENEYVVDYEHPVLGKVRLLASPVKFSKMSSNPRLPAPELGEHTEEILLEADYTWEEIAELKEEEVI
ncbi:CaiB/BaiF CoA transferase family protein [Chloroflexota bacterium]